MRLGKTESCQPPPTRKRGRPPRKAPPPDDHHPRQLQPPPPDTVTTAQAQAATAASKRLCVRPKTTDPVVDPPGDSQPPQAALAGPHCFPSSSSTTTSPSSSASSSSSSSLSPPSSSPPLPTAGFAPEALPAQSQEQGSQEEGLRSLLMLVVDQMREMRRENARLHDTIAQLCATQEETERRLARVEQDQQQARAETERRLARLERDHQTIRRCQLAQTGVEPEPAHTCTSHACSPSLVVARPALPPQWALDSESSWCVGMPLVSAAAPATSRAAEVERFIAQTLPFLRAFDQSSLILRDLQRPFVVMRMNEIETLDDLVPIIVYASPALCKLLGYDHVEMQGFPISSFCLVDQEFVPGLVQMVLTPSPTPVSQPLWVTVTLDTKHGRRVRVSTDHQILFNHRRMAQWAIVQVDRILDMDRDLAPFTSPSPSAIVLLLGRRGGGRELTTTTRRPGAPYHDRDSHREAFDEQTGVVGELPTQKEEAPVALAGQQQHHDETTTQPGVELRADAELEELIRVLLGPSLGRARSPHTAVVGFSSRPPPSPTPSILAERWMR